MFELYHIEYTSGNTTVVEVIPHPASNHTILGLVNATEYSVRVAVNNTAGLGSYSSPPITAQTSDLRKCIQTHLQMTLHFDKFMP